MTSRARTQVLLGLLFVSACARPPDPETSQPAQATRPALVETAWPEVQSCRELPAELAAMLEAGKAPSRSNSAPLALIDLGARGFSSAAGAELVADLPIERGTADAPPTARCLLIVDRPEGGSRVDRRSLGKTSIYSEYAASTKRRLNPEHAKLEKELRRLEDGDKGDGGRMRASGILAYDLLALGGTALISGISGFYDGQRQDELATKVRATPQYIEEQDWKSYKLQIEELAIDKRAGLRVALVDNVTGQSWQTTRNQQESIRVALADGLHPRDRTNLEGGARRLVGPAELAELEEAPLQVKLTNLVTGLAAEVARDQGRPSSLAALLGEWGRSDAVQQAGVEAVPNPATPGRTSAKLGRARPTASGRSSLVRVEGLGGKASGFYVAPEKILTLHAALGGSSLVKVEAADGFVTWGVVQHEDPKAGIALIHVQRAGTPLPLGSAEATLASFKGPGADAGAPLLDGGRVVGISIDPTRGRAVGTAELARFLAAAEER